MKYETQKLNTAAQALGRLGKGIKKTLSAEERQRRSKFMEAYNTGRRGIARGARHE
jgi:hypothetical protein